MLTSILAKYPWRKYLRRGALACSAVALVLCAGLYAATAIWPEVGAQGADLLRKVFGVEAVAQLETIVYDGYDQWNQQLAQLGLKQAQSPWDINTPTAEPTAMILAPSPFAGAQSTPSATVSVAQQSITPATGTGAQQIITPQPTRPPLWQPEPVKPFTTKAGEGQWLSYIIKPNGQAVAYRTFLASDPERPYVVIGIVAFDLRATRLHFVVGSDEPKSTVKVERTGCIPKQDFLTGQLLAVFNGGFKSEHGQFGAMANGAVLLPARNGLMTVAFTKDGAVKMGAWGQDDLPTTDAIAWRQNGPPIIRNGQINPLTEQMTTHNWGGAIDGNVAVWRSALGLSVDGNTLFYAAGDGLVMPTLARALKAVGAQHAMQLDINNYWVYFGAVKSENGSLLNEPLFDKMKDHQRYLKCFSRDYFYVTAGE